MAFGTPRSDDIQQLGSGERQGDNNTILSSTVFENGLMVGRFAKLDAGSIDNIDGSATPVPAGVVLRNVASPVEDGDAIDSALYGQVEYLRQGLVTIDVVTGQTPAQFGAVSISNAGDADDGKALATGGVAVNAEFIHEVQPDVWLINIISLNA